MATDAYAIERQKKFKYRLEINGLPVAVIQSVTLGSEEIGVTKHAGAGQNHPVKEAGMIEYEPVTLKAVVPLDGSGLLYWERWMRRIQDPETGNGLRKKQYAQDFSLYDLDPAGNVIGTWEFQNGWVQKRSPGERDSMSKDEDVIDEIVIEYDRRAQK
jgi:hypothetical protein